MNDKPLTNDDLSATAFCDMGDAIELAQSRLKRAALYGYDMRSSRALIVQDVIRMLSNSLQAELEQRYDG